ncbi:MAG TPA: hypothetical protein VFF65_05135 [Phycisphaerales bacterium]|nr:hypothetical protein [Phycisphaerales bacterium]
MAPEQQPAPIPPLGSRPSQPFCGRITFQAEQTIDGEQIRPGGLYYCRARLHPPLVRVRVTRQHRTTRSWLDGQLVALWEVVPEDAKDGHRVIVEPWMLSAAPVDEVLRRLLQRGA